MLNDEGCLSVEESNDLVGWRIARRQSLMPNVARMQNLATVEVSSPTKELDAVVLGKYTCRLRRQCVTREHGDYRKYHQVFEDGGDAWKFQVIKSRRSGIVHF